MLQSPRPPEAALFRSGGGPFTRMTPALRRGSTRATLLALACAVTLALSAAACGGDDGNGASSTPRPSQTASADQASYYDALKKALGDSHQSAQGLQAFRESAMDPARSSDERKQGSVEYGSRYADFTAARQAAIEQLAPPPGVEGPHAALLQAAKDATALGEMFRDGVAASPAADDAALASAFTQLNGVAIEKRFRDACQDVQTYAARLSVAVDLGCNL